MRLRLSHFLTVKQEGFLLRFYPSSLSAASWIDPVDHQAEAAFLRRCLRPGDVVIDVGANVGLTTLAASRAVGDSGKVIAVEPHPRIFSYLQGNVALNEVRNVSTHNVALGSQEGTLHLSDMRADDQNFIASGGRGIEIPVRRLDDLPIEGPRVAMLKIDVEGYEKLVLEGATATLARTQCVYFESWDQHFARYGYRSVDLVRSLSERGFQVFRLHETEQLSAISSDHSSSEIENLVALRGTDEFLRRTGFSLHRG